MSFTLFLCFLGGALLSIVNDIRADRFSVIGNWTWEYAAFRGLMEENSHVLILTKKKAQCSYANTAHYWEGKISR